MLKTSCFRFVLRRNGSPCRLSHTSVCCRIFVAATSLIVSVDTRRVDISLYHSPLVKPYFSWTYSWLSSLVIHQTIYMCMVYASINKKRAAKSNVRSSPLTRNSDFLCVVCSIFSPRRRQGIIVTAAMEESLREILSWHARTCGEALVGGIFQVCIIVEFCMCRARKPKCRFSKEGARVTFSLFILFPACFARKMCDGRAASSVRLMAWCKHAGAVQALISFP